MSLMAGVYRLQYYTYQLEWCCKSFVHTNLPIKQWLFIVMFEYTNWTLDGITNGQQGNIYSVTLIYYQLTLARKNLYKMYTKV